VGVVELHAVEAGLARPSRGVGEQIRQHTGQIADVRQVEVSDALAVPVVEGFQLARGEDGFDERSLRSGQARAHLGVRRGGRVAPAVVAERLGEPAPEIVADLEIPREVGRRLRTPTHRDEVDDLDEEARVAFAPLPHGLDQAPESGDEAVAADAEEWAAGHVADAGGFDDQHAGLARGEAGIPLEHLGRDVTVLGRPPRDHRGHPRAVGGHAAGTEAHWGEPAGPGGLLPRRPARCRQRMSDAEARRCHDGHMVSLPRRRDGQPG
jgi:hypothetical protein